MFKPNIEKMKIKKDVKGFLKTLKYSDRVLVVDAINVLGEIKDKSAAEPLIENIFNKDKSIRLTAIFALGKIAGSRAVEPLISFIKSLSYPDRDTQIYAIFSLGEIGDSRAVKPLVKFMIVGDSNIREQVAIALDKIGWTPEDDIEKAYYLISKKKFDELAILGSSNFNVLFKLLDDSDYKICKAAAEILRQLKDERAIEPLIKVIKEGKMVGASYALAAIGKPTRLILSAN